MIPPGAVRAAPVPSRPCLVAAVTSVTVVFVEFVARLTSTRGAAQCAHGQVTRGSVARQVLLLQVLVVLLVVVVGARARGLRRPPGRARAARVDRARRGGPDRRRLPRRARRAGRADPSRRPAAVRRAGARGHRRRLRRRDGPRPDPLHPPQPRADRQEVHRRPRRRARGRGLHPGVHRHARALDARGGAGRRRRRQVVALVSVGITIETIDKALPRDAAARRASPAPAVLARRRCSAPG